MTVTSTEHATEQQSAPLVIVSCDTHIGPRLGEDLRPYCPKEHLDVLRRLRGGARGDAAGDVGEQREVGVRWREGSGAAGALKSTTSRHLVIFDMHVLAAVTSTPTVSPAR